jgi:hypothetical protein
MTALPTSTPVPINTATPTPVSCNGSQQLLVNPSFEAGTAPWTLRGLAYRDTRQAFDGSYSMFLGGYNNANDFFAQSVIVPTWAETATLYFTTAMFSQDSTLGRYDGLVAAVFDPSARFLADGIIWNNSVRGQWTAWRMPIGDVRALRGAIVTPAFQASTDGSLYTSWWVDRVWLVFACGSTPAQSASSLQGEPALAANGDAPATSDNAKAGRQATVDAPGGSDLLSRMQRAMQGPPAR